MHTQSIINFLLLLVLSVTMVTGVQAEPLHQKGWDKNKTVLVRASRDSGVPLGRLTTFASVESGIGENNLNRHSKASGMMQFTRSTWKTQVKQHARKYGLSRNVSRGNAYASAVIGAEYIKFNEQFLADRLHRPISDADIYIAYLLGPDKAAKVLKANPSHRVTRYVNVSRGNYSLFYHKNRPMTIAEFRRGIAAKLARHESSYKNVVLAMKQRHAPRDMMKDEAGFDRLVANL
jgi:hypothetical protein